MAVKYQTVNGAWPESVPPLTGPEAISATKRLIRLATKQSFKGRFKMTSGNRRGKFYGSTITINPDAGWKLLVHSVSHRCHWQLHRHLPDYKSHDDMGRHAFVERTMIQHVVNSGWLDGKLKRPAKEKPAIDPKRKRYDSVIARIERWEAKAKRAKAALQKLSRQKAYYEKRLSA